MRRNKQGKPSEQQVLSCGQHCSRKWTSGGTLPKFTTQRGSGCNASAWIGDVAHRLHLPAAICRVCPSSWSHKAIFAGVCLLATSRCRIPVWNIQWTQFIHIYWYQGRISQLVVCGCSLLCGVKWITWLSGCSMSGCSTNIDYKLWLHLYHL